MQSMQLPEVALAVRAFFVIAFFVITILYALRVAGFVRSSHTDKMTDITHLVMAVAMFAMFAWPNWLM